VLMFVANHLANRHFQHMDERPFARQARCYRRSEHFWVAGALLVGIAVGLVVPLEDTGGHKQPEWCRRVSSLLGWTYFCAWSASFYPQVVLNCKRRSVIGLSFDYQLLNLVGFCFYFAFNALLFWNPRVKEEYAEAHSGHGSAVRLNDVIFSGHASLITAITLLQICLYWDYPRLDRWDRCLRIVVVSFLTVVLGMAIVLATVIAVQSEQLMNWASYLWLVSQVKVVISVCKYCPQVLLNYRRKSTEGWNISNVLLDFSGGLLSTLQLLLDSWAQSDWSAVTGDPAKLLLGNLSMVFDTIFLVQHYWLYSSKTAREQPTTLLPEPPPSGLGA